MAVEWGVYKFPADPNKVYAEIQSLGIQYTTDEVLELARNPETELHKCLDWDDAVAAEKWRKEQVRLVCRSLVVVVQKTETEETKYRVIEHDHEEKVYREVRYTHRNKDQYAVLLNQAKADMNRFIARYKSLVELSEVIEQIEIALNA